MVEKTLQAPAAGNSVDHTNVASCVRCSFAVKVHVAGDIRGHHECRMAPPQIIAATIRGNAIGNAVGFPQVNEGMFCFQFAARAADS